MTAPIRSQQVDWWATHVFITELVYRANNLPAAGTPAWCALPDSDPRKLIALAAAGEHHVLRVEAAQAALADAGTEMSAATDWTAVARNNFRHANAVRSGAYIGRRSA